MTLPSGATIQDVAGNNADLTRATTIFTNVAVDTTPPTITADTANPATGTYGTGQTITFTLTGSEKLTVTGAPTLKLNDGGVASYVAGSGTSSLLFRYTIAANQSSSRLAVQAVTLPSGSKITDAAGNTANLAAAAATFTGLVIDTRSPAVTAIVANPALGSIGAGQTITLTLATSEPVIVTGTPALTLNDGGTATYVSGSGTASLVFSTIVAAGQNALTLAVIGVSLPAGAAIQDAAGNTADLTGAIAAFSGLTVNTIPPSISGTAGGQGVADNATIRPFASIQVLDARPSPTETVTITVLAGGVASDADGLLAGTGLTQTDAGTYALAAGSPGAVTAAARQCVPRRFTPGGLGVGVSRFRCAASGRVCRAGPPPRGAPAHRKRPGCCAFSRRAPHLAGLADSRRLPSPAAARYPDPARSSAAAGRYASRAYGW